MNNRRSRTAPALSFTMEALEGRIALSGVHAAGVVHPGAARVATVTTMAVSAGTLNQPITVTVTVKGPAAAGAPSGTVNITDHGVVLKSLTLSPTTSTNPRTAVSQATYTLPQAPGSAGYFFGRHTFNAQFIPGGAYSKSSAVKAFNVTQPPATTLDGGVKIATLTQGSGPQVQPGQTANLTYTGYLTSTGQVFDDSDVHGGTPLGFKVGAGQVIPGFDIGTVGMQVGESRMILIPPAEGYGSTAVGSIPANSTLIFVVTLKSIS